MDYEFWVYIVASSTGTLLHWHDERRSDCAQDDRF